MSRGATAHINLRALTANLDLVKSITPSSKVLAVVKSNGYGHGLVQIAGALQRVDAFGVSRMVEALGLRQAGVTKPILLLEGVMDDAGLELAVRNDLAVVLHSSYQLSLIEQSTHLDPERPLQIWLKLDTGMNRLGFSGTEIDAVKQRVEINSELELKVVMSHLSCADDVEDQTTDRQIESFTRITANWPMEKSLANSGGLVAWPSSHFDWVRPGLMLYGASPFSTPLDKLSPLVRERLGQLQPVMTFKSRLIAVKEVARGGSIGYGGHWTCTRDSLIGVVAVGYGDGYPRSAKSGTPVLLNGSRYPVVGRVSMGMLCIELDPGKGGQVGDEVILWGPGLPIEEVAVSIGVIPYELMTGVTGRVEFHYA